MLKGINKSLEGTKIISTSRIRGSQKDSSKTILNHVIPFSTANSNTKAVFTLEIELLKLESIIQQA